MAESEGMYTLRGSVFSEDFQNDLKKIKSLSVDVAGVDLDQGIIDVLMNDEEHTLLQNEGFVVEVNWVQGVSVDPYIDEEYKTSFEVEQFLQTAHGLFPELTKLLKIGESLEGRSIWALKISDDAENEDPSESAVLFNSMHHAREVMTPEVPIDLIEYLLSNYESDERVKTWIDNTEIWVVPMLNVDGNNMVWQGQEFWRKNTRGGYGVDLNRNYPFGWNSCRGSSGRKNDDDYRGPSPASEPETRALMSLVSDIKPVFNISYHSYSELVLYPYGCRNSNGALNESMVTIGKELGHLLDYRAGTPWELLYEADGSDIDWMLNDEQVIPYVFELNSRREGFHPRYKDARDKTVELNRKAWMHLLDRLSGPGIKGVVPKRNLVGDEDQFIKVFKNKKLLQKYRINPDGSFHIVLNSGEYELDFSFSNDLRTIEIKSEVFEVKKF